MTTSLRARALPAFLVSLALLSVSLSSTSARADEDTYATDDGLSTPVLIGATTLGVGSMTLLFGTIALGGGIALGTLPAATFQAEDGSTVLIAQALTVAGGVGVGLGLCLTGGGAGALAAHTFFE